MGEERILAPGDTWKFGGQEYTVRQPDGASPMYWLQPTNPEVPGMIWLAQGESEGFEVGLPGSAWSLGGLEHVVGVSALDTGLRIECKGGVRRSEGEGDFGGAQPYQEANWKGATRQSFWNSVHQGPGAPLFITLDPLTAV
jgi:hypothetical protein